MKVRLISQGRIPLPVFLPIGRREGGKSSEVGAGDALKGRATGRVSAGFETSVAFTVIIFVFMHAIIEDPLRHPTS